MNLMPDFTLGCNNIFTDNWDEPPVLRDGERLYRIHTDNPSDNLFTVRPANGRYNRITDEDFREHVRSMLRGKFGKRGWYMLDELEDVTDLYYGKEE